MLGIEPKATGSGSKYEFAFRNLILLFSVEGLNVQPSLKNLGLWPAEFMLRAWSVYYGISVGDRKKWSMFLQ